jgi:hypothetical protein
MKPKVLKLKIKSSSWMCSFSWSSASYSVSHIKKKIYRMLCKGARHIIGAK